MSERSLQVYLADDHEIVAKAIASLLISIEGVENVKTFSTGEELYNACLSGQPDLVILDMEMPGWNGILTLENLKAISNAPVIILSMNDEKAIIEESLKKGAKAYLHKNCSLEELKNAIDTVMQGNIFLSEETKKIIVGLKHQARDQPYELTEPLTEKDLEVLRLVCEGLTSKEIGERLFLSPRTVETRKNHLMQKFNVQTTGKLIAIAIKNKIVN